MDFTLVLFALLSVMLAGTFAVYVSLAAMEEQFEALYVRLRILEGDIATLHYNMSEDKDD
jgi:hypothetical protein